MTSVRVTHFVTVMTRPKAPFRKQPKEGAKRGDEFEELIQGELSVNKRLANVRSWIEQVCESLHSFPSLASLI